VRLVGALDRGRRVTAVPFQQPGVPEAAGLTLADCEGAAWALADDPIALFQGRRRRYRGAAAVNAALATALGTWLPLLLYALPGIRWLQDRAYDWVARNRSRLPGDTPFCEQFPARCRPAEAGVSEEGALP
jgi:predicted DCC family thiol-disulfide oxidoreductase YuxK